MSKPLEVLISGSGIAGSVFASWLLRAHPNANITIVERAPSLRLTGASVDIRSSAVDIIKWMGAEEEIRKHTTKEEGIQFVRGDGTAIGTFGATGRTDIQSFTSEFEIFRGALAEVFMRPIQERVTLIFDESVDSFRQLDDGVEVTFRKSKEIKAYDLLVAADGFGSRIRGQMLDKPSREQIHGEGCHVAYFTIKQDLLQGSRLAKWYNAPGGRVTLIRPDPSGYVRGHLMNVTTSADTETRDRLNKALDEGHEAYKKFLEDTFHDVGWLTPEVLKGMRQSDDFYCSLFAQVRSPSLHSGRVVLLGDAGYATPGFGTSLAIMGGYVLAGELLRHPGNVEAALKQYEKLMLPFAQGSQGGDFNPMPYLNPQTRWGIGIRDVIIRVVAGLKLDRLAIAGASALGWSEKKLGMPEYDWPEEDS